MDWIYGTGESVREWYGAWCPDLLEQLCVVKYVWMALHSA
jgi:hypothetical protein